MSLSYDVKKDVKLIFSQKGLADLWSVWLFLLTDMSVRLRRPGVRVRGPGARHPSVGWMWWRVRSRHLGGAVSPAPAGLANTSVDVGTFLKNNKTTVRPLPGQTRLLHSFFSTHPVGAALHLWPALDRMVLRTVSVGQHSRDVFTSLVQTDPVVSAANSVLDNPHDENTRAVVQPAGHYLALHVFVLVVSLRAEHSFRLQSSNKTTYCPSPPLSLHLSLSPPTLKFSANI